MEEPSICRTCALPCVNIRIPLATTNPEILSDLNFIIQGHLEPVSDADTQPKWVCRNCMERIQASADFLRQTIRAYNSFLAREENVQIPVDEIIEIPDNDPVQILPSKKRRTIITQNSTSSPSTPSRSMCTTPVARTEDDVEESLDTYELFLLPKQSQLEELETLENSYDNPDGLTLTPNTKVIPCNYCDMKFVKADELGEHLLVEHKFIAAIYPCKRCSKTFVTQQFLTQHEAEHNVETQSSEEADATKQAKGSYVCKVCGVSYWSRVSLLKHKQDDHPEMLHTCPNCGRSYMRRYDMDRHMLRTCTASQKLIETHEATYEITLLDEESEGSDVEFVSMTCFSSGIQNDS